MCVKLQNYFVFYILSVKFPAAVFTFISLALSISNFDSDFPKYSRFEFFEFELLFSELLLSLVDDAVGSYKKCLRNLFLKK